MYECVRFGDHADSSERPECSCCASLQCGRAAAYMSVRCLQLGVEKHFSLWISSWIEHTGDAAPVQIVLNLFSMDSQ